MEEMWTHLSLSPQRLAAVYQQEEEKQQQQQQQPSRTPLRDVSNESRLAASAPVSPGVGKDNLAPPPPPLPQQQQQLHQQTHANTQHRGGVPDAVFKVLVLGNAKCGKTSLIRRFVEDSFRQQYASTIGAEFVRKDVEFEGNCVRLRLYDLAGQDRFILLTRTCFKGARGVLCVCDLTREDTLEAVKQWKQEVDRFTPEGEHVPVVLLANKSDLLDDARASFVAGAEMEKLCNEAGFVRWFVTSAKTGENVQNAIHVLTSHMMQQLRARGGSCTGGDDSEQQQQHRQLHQDSAGYDQVDAAASDTDAAFQLKPVSDNGAAGGTGGSCC